MCYSIGWYAGDRIQCMFNKTCNGCGAVLAECFGYTVGYDRTKAEALVSEQSAESVNATCFHFKISDPVVAKLKFR